MTTVLLFGGITVLSVQTLFLFCPGFLATGVVDGIESLPSVDVIFFVIFFFFVPKDRNFRRSLNFSLSFFWFQISIGTLKKIASAESSKFPSPQRAPTRWLYMRNRMCSCVCDDDNYNYLVSRLILYCLIFILLNFLKKIRHSKFCKLFIDFIFQKLI